MPCAHDWVHVFAQFDTVPVWCYHEFVQFQSLNRELESDDDIEKYFLQNQQTSMSNLVLSEEFDEETDLTVSVDSPEKHVTAMESYVTFRVCTNVNGDDQ